MEYPFTALGKMFGASDVAVKKWCKSEGIEIPDRRGYWAKIKAGKMA